MERQSRTWQPVRRDVTAEILYLDELHAAGNQGNKAFYEIDETERQRYEAAAEQFDETTERPNILDQFEHYDTPLTDVKASCLALADTLYELKGDTPLTSVDIVVDHPAVEVLARLEQIKAGKLLTKKDKQLAIQSDGSYYPKLDIKKEDTELQGVGLRVRGWDDQKNVFMNTGDKPYRYPDDLLVYPASEKEITRQLELYFHYTHPEAGRFLESVSLEISTRGSAGISRKIFASAYAETGYEGHLGKALNKCSEQDIVDFTDLCADIVGDEPESREMLQVRRLDDLISKSATPEAAYTITRNWLK